MTPRTLLFPLGLSLASLFPVGCSPEKAAAPAGEATGAGGAVSSVAKPGPAWPVELVKVSGPVSPDVAYALARQGDDLLLVIEAAGFEASGADVSVRAGLAADRTLTLTDAQAQTVRKDGRALFRFVIPSAQLVDAADHWKKLRFGFSVEWAGSPGGTPRQRERFLHVGYGATHAGLSPRTADWSPVDLGEVAREAADRASQIAIDFTQPLDGKATIVIDGPDGRRVRNLVSGQPLGQGRHRIVWDGLDEQGNLVPPGDYRWRSISHAGLRPVHQFDFVDAPGSNHGTFHAAATNGKRVFLGTPVSEGGHQVVVLEKDGAFVRGFNAPHGTGLGRIALAADERYIYAAYDGTGWGTKVDRTKAGWKSEQKINLVRFDIESGAAADYPSKNRTPLLLTYEVGPGSPGAKPEGLALRSLVLLNGRLYLADGFNGQVLDIDPATGVVARTFPLADLGALAGGGDALLAIVKGNRLVRVDPKTGAATAVAELAGKPAALTTGDDGRIFVSDGEAQVVRVLDAKSGRETAVIGKPGGIAPGPYDPQRLQNPAGLAVCDGLVWVTENNRWQPKRFAAYDTRTGLMAKEFFGPTNYGSQGAGFDDQDSSHWIGQGTLFQLDFAARPAKPLSILGGETGRRHTFWRQDGRTFILTSGKVTYIQELRADGTLKPLAALSSAHQFAYNADWRPPAAFGEAFARDYPALKVTPGQRGGIERLQPNHGYGMLWVDRSGDGEMQSDEIEFATAADNLGGSGWSHDFHDLTMRVPATVAGKKVLVTLKPDGWWPGGAPKYPSLNDAARAGTPIDLPGPNQVESAVDRFGNTVLNSSPDMRAFAPDGRLLWTYANKWSGVHGSHDAPLPVTGQMQGALFFSGMVPLDDKADVMLLNGNHGRAFVLSSDGLYIDEMFPDVRQMTNPQAGGIGILGGECFGGTFGRSARDGNYYFQGGGISYRIYRIEGLKDIRRQEGALTVNAAQAAAAERGLTRRVVAQTAPRETVIPVLVKSPVIDGAADNDWPGVAGVTWKNGDKFTVTVRAATDATMLYLHYTVRGDDSPWVNKGTDWQALFKTGDGVDLQIGTDPAANPKRTGPVPGDLRLFIAPSAAGDTAVLYRHRVPGAKDAEGVVFQSPWRSEKVDIVRRLETATVAVKKDNGGYRVEAAIPLADLELTRAAGRVLRGDFGVIYGDAAGTANVFRNYWANPSTGLVNDVPGEVMLTPGAWGKLTFEGTTTETKEATR